MIVGSVARRYAKALLQIGIEDKSLEKIDAELATFGELIAGSKELAETLADPTVLPSGKNAVLKELVEKLKLSETTSNFIRLLGEKGRIAGFADMHREFKRLADEQAGRARGTVTSATTLPKDVESSIANTLSKVTGRQVELTHRVDPDLLGGMVAEIGGVIYDGSLRTQLRRLRDTASR